MLRLKTIMKMKWLNHQSKSNWSYQFQSHSLKEFKTHFSGDLLVSFWTQKYHNWNANINEILLLILVWWQNLYTRHSKSLRKQTKQKFKTLQRGSVSRKITASLNCLFSKTERGKKVCPLRTMQSFINHSRSKASTHLSQRSLYSQCTQWDKYELLV